MPGESMIAIAPIVGLVFNALVQITAIHILRSSITLSILIGAICGLAGTSLLLLLGHRDNISSYVELVDTWCVGILSYAALAMGFWSFLNLNITSLRIRVLRTILSAGGKMSFAELEKCYSPAERIHRRIRRLQLGGQIEIEGGRWRLCSWQVLTIARGIELLRALVFPASDRGL